MVNGKWQREQIQHRLLATRIAEYEHIQAGAAEKLAIATGTVRALLRRMEKSRDLRVRSFQFTIDIVNFSRTRLTSDAIIRRLAYQLVDSAGSVGANLEESGAGQTKPDFIAKQCIALKEARESRFWLRVIAATSAALSPATKPHIQEATELVAMLIASIKTAKSNPYRGEADTASKDEDC